jgi:hypothetical protein
MLAMGFLIFIGIGVWRGYFKKPDPLTNQSAEKIINNYNSPNAPFGCATTRDYTKHLMNALK